MPNHWFVYKNKKQKGPYTWEQLWREAQSGHIKPGDLVWNRTMREWVPASRIPGLINKKRNYLVTAVIASAVFFVVLSGTAFYYLFFYTGPQVAELEDRPGLELAGEAVEGEEIGDDELLIADRTDNRDTRNNNQAPFGDSSQEAGSPNGEPEQEINDHESATSSNEGKQAIPFQGGTYTGPLQDGLPHGYGTWIHPSGLEYEGEFIRGNIEGYGIMTFPDGERYTGYFKDAKAHGQGTMTHPDGRFVSGEWIDGILQEAEEQGNGEQ